MRDKNSASGYESGCEFYGKFKGSTEVSIGFNRWKSDCKGYR
jgi:hypothetical protein